MRITCAFCGFESDKPTGEVNRARKAGLNLYCSRECAGLARRSLKTIEQKKAEKRLYDIEYREKNRTKLKVKKHEYFRRTYDPEKAAIERKARMAGHVEYCRRPDYRQWKKRYDRKYRAKKFYGPFWECFVLTLDLRDAALERMTDYEIRLSKGTLNKCIQRKREYERSLCKDAEVGPLGNLEQGQKR